MMRVFTSVFVLESVHATFDEMEEALRTEPVVSMNEGANVPRRQMVELHVKKEAGQDQRVWNG